MLPTVAYSLGVSDFILVVSSNGRDCFSFFFSFCNLNAYLRNEKYFDRSLICYLIYMIDLEDYIYKKKIDRIII